MWQEVDHLGKALFGRPLRLRVLIWVYRQTEPFFQAQAASGVEYNSAPAVAAELSRLCDLGMVRSFGRPQKQGRLYYQRADSPLWSILPVILDVIEEAVEETDAG